MLRGGQGRYPYNRGNHLIAAIELYAYGDESGIQSNAKYCLLLGYVGEPNQWDSFNEQWSSVLGSYNTPRFHASHFFQGREPYRKWNAPKRDAYLLDLLNIINRHNIVPIGWALDVAAFNSLRDDERRYLTGGYIETSVELRRNKDWSWRDPRLSRRFKGNVGVPTQPYFYVFQHFFTDAWDIMSDNTRLNLVLDRQSLMEAHAVQQFHETALRWNDPSFGDSKELGDIVYADSSLRLPLQAADLYAYAVYRHLDVSKDKRLRLALNQLGQKKPKINVANREYLQSQLAEIRNLLREDSVFFQDQPIDQLEEQR